MGMRIVLPALVMALTPSCKSVDCGPGTAERNGACVPSSETVSAAKCGPFTVLQGDTCVHSPMFPPTVCDPATTAEDTDTATGVTTCIGTGAAGCSAKLACPTPAAGDSKQTICGQIYDFETGSPFAQAGATGAQCTPGATTGPCSLGIHAFDAVAFSMNPAGTPPLATDAVYIDDCGRYKVPGVAQPSGPLIALAIDDASPANQGAAGVTNPVGVATPAKPGSATKDLEAFMVKGAIAAGWSGPSLATGIFAALYHGHSTGIDPAAGVTMTRNGAAGDAAHTFYFGAGAASRTTVDATAHVTGVNGAVLYTITAPMLTDVYSGTSALPSGCAWEPHAGAAIPGVVFIQVFRPTGTTCTL